MNAGQKLAKAVVQVLNKKELRNINFDYNGLVVTHARFMVVRDKVQSGAIKCGVANGGTLAAGTVSEAQYIATKYNSLKLPPDQFMFPHEDYGSDPILRRSAYEHEACAIVHEATHAIFDIFMKGEIRAADNEAAAYLAAGLFSEATQYGMQTTVNDPREVGMKLAKEIFPILQNGRTYTIPGKIRDALKEPIKDAYADPNSTIPWEQMPDTMDGVP